MPRRAIFSVMIELRINRHDTRYEAAQPAKSGSKLNGCNVVSKANTAEASRAREEPANNAAMPTSAAILTSTPASGTSHWAAAPQAAPSPPPMVNRGASVPPEVPLPSEIDQETNFIAHRNTTALSGS